MRKQFSTRLLAGATFVAVMVAGAVSVAQAPLAIASGRVTIAGNSNVHAYTASTTTVQVTRAHVATAAAGVEFWDNALKPGAIDAFEIVIPAGTLKSPKGDLDKNMYKALKVEECPNITFRLVRFEANDSAGRTRAIGMLTIAGVEREVALTLTTKRTTAGLTVQGSLDLQMTDYGIVPPKAMLGMLKTDPKVTITFETLLTIPTTT
jgi:polyisoprenoid-binding protein YceI